MSPTIEGYLSTLQNPLQTHKISQSMDRFVKEKDLFNFDAPERSMSIDCYRTRSQGSGLNSQMLPKCSQYTPRNILVI